MIYVVFETLGVVSLVCKEIDLLLKHIEEKGYHTIQIWNKGRHVGGMVTPK